MNNICEKSLFLKFKYWYYTNYKWDFYNSCKLFGLDFGWFLINNRKFTYIEDCPDVYTIWETGALYQTWKQFQKKPRLLRNFYKFLFGPVFMNYVGTSENVNEIITTKEVDREYLKGKLQIVVSLQDMWNNSTAEKKRLVLSLFGISDDDLRILQSRSIVLFTQAFSEDGIMSEKEKISIYSQILSNYDKNRIIIKKHPRDKTNYSDYIKGVEVFDKPCPAQLLDLAGIKYERAITISSTSVLSLPKPIEIDWIGNEVHPNLLRKYGHQDLSML